MFGEDANVYVSEQVKHWVLHSVPNKAVRAITVGERKGLNSKPGG